MVKTYTLSNGIHVVAYKISQVKSIHLSVVIKGGSMVEETGTNGVAHFMEHMLVQGIPSFPSVEKLSTYIEGLAGSYNAYTSQLAVSFGISLPFVHLEEAMKIASEVIFSPTFPAEVLEKERKAVITEITQRKDALGYKLGKYYRTTRYVPDSIMHREVGGALDDVKKITHEDVLAYWKKFFFPQNTYVYVGGNFTDAQLQAHLHTYFASKKGEGTFVGFPLLTQKEFADRKVVIKTDKELGTNYLALSFPSMPLEQDWKTTIRQDIGLTILGQLRTSRLFKLLRYQKGLVYNVSAQRALLPGIGYIDISSEMATENVPEVLQLISQTLHEYITNGPTQEELDFVKHYYTSSWLMAFDNPGSVADWLEEELLWEDKVRMPEEYIAMIKEITRGDIIAVMQKYWNLSKLQLLIQGPIEATEDNKATFTKFLKDLV